MLPCCPLLITILYHKSTAGLGSLTFEGPEECFSKAALFRTGLESWAQKSTKRAELGSSSAFRTYFFRPSIL
ncbi:hypothetical protein GQ53DRAFT_319396 [Thozetella sp. PMI_491]|nr:hypothetical protein GQ53DRAFT_319396 [Thozetella sp. PMI_491]